MISFSSKKARENVSVLAPNLPVCWWLYGEHFQSKLSWRSQRHNIFVLVLLDKTRITTSVCLSICMCLYLSIFLSFISLPVYLSVYLSFYLSVCLSVCIADFTFITSLLYNGDTPPSVCLWKPAQTLSMTWNCSIAKFSLSSSTTSLGY